MAVHALNLIDPRNWRKKTGKLRRPTEKVLGIHSPEAKAGTFSASGSGARSQADDAMEAASGSR